MSGGTAYEQLIDAQRRLHGADFAARPEYVVVRIKSVDRDSLDNPSTARGEIGDVDGFPINVGGHAVEEGEYIIAAFPKDNPAGGVLEYKGHYSSDLPGAGIVRKRPGPAPTFAPSTWHTERIDSIPNAISCKITIYFQVEAKYIPSKVYIVHRRSGTNPLTGLAYDYTDQPVPFILTNSIQQAEIAVPYNTGTAVDVKLRAEYQYAYGPSDASEVRTITTPVDTTTPGSASALAVSVAVSGQLRLEASGTVDRSRFVGWRYEIATSPTGPPIATAVVDGPYTYYAAAGGTFYVAVAPIGIGNNLGSRFPSNTITVFDGPHTVSVASLPPDITAPAAWSAPTLTSTIQQQADGSKAAYLKVTFPARGTFEPDYKATHVRLYNGTTYDHWTIPYRGVAPDPTERQVGFGSYTVWIYAEDTSGNFSALSASAAITISAPGVPDAPGDPTTDQLGLAVAINFRTAALASGMPDGAELVEVQRATSSGGAGAVTIAQIKGVRWLDVQTDATSLPVTYWYRTRGRNIAGDGSWSNWVSGTVNRIDGTVVSAGTLNGDRVITNTLDANTLKTTTALVSLLQTAPSGTRWEIEGHTGSGTQDRIRFIENVSGVDKERIRATGTGFTVFGDSAQTDITMARNGSGRGELSAGNGIAIFNSALIQFRSDIIPLRFLTNTAYASLQSLSFHSYSETVPTIVGPAAASNPVFQLRDTSDTRRMALFSEGIESYAVGGAYGLQRLSFVPSPLDAANQYVNFSDGVKVNTKLHIGGLTANVFTGYPLAVGTSKQMGASGGVTLVELQKWAYTALPDGYQQELLLQAVRATASDYYYNNRYRLVMTYAQGHVGGALDLGLRNTADPYWGLMANGDTKMFWEEGSTRVNIPYGLVVSGTKSFIIPHPDPEKAADYDLRHASVEGPTRGDTLYRFVITIPANGVNRDRRIELPDYFAYLNENPQVWIAAADGFGAAYGAVNNKGDAVIVRANTAGTYNVLVMGTRKDADALASWDEDEGPVIPRVAHPDFEDDEHKRRRVAAARGETRMARKARKTDQLGPLPALDSAPVDIPATLQTRGAQKAAEPVQAAERAREQRDRDVRRAALEAEMAAAHAERVAKEDAENAEREKRAQDKTEKDQDADTDNTV